MEKIKKFLKNGQPELALENLKKILDEENFSDEWKIHELFGATFHDLANAAGSAQAYLNAAQTDFFLRSQRQHFSNFLFALHYLPQENKKIFYENAKIYGSLYRDAEILPQKNISNKKIHIGFIATHFFESSAARFFEILLTDYDKNKFFVSAWSLTTKTDNFTEKIKNSVDKFFAFDEINFYEIAEKIQREKVEILFDLSGHTDGGETLQILSYKPAKIQISGIGYFDTTGTNFIDYFLTDKFLTKFDKDFSEKFLFVENAFAFKPTEKIIFAKKNLRKIAHENIIFGCLNNFMKITDEYLNCVKKILDGVENSKIIFRDTTPLESRKKALEEKILRAGIKNFEVRHGENNFFSDYGETDLILDTFPYGGGFMTALAIFFEIPVINLVGEKHFERIGAEILKNVGLEEFIAKNVDEYIMKAKNFKKIGERRIFLEKLTDAKSFAKNFYEAIEALR